MSYTLGIDLGTTYSAAAVHSEGVAEIFSLGHRATVVPSVVFVAESGDVLVGEPALRRGAIEPERLCREFKRRIGDSAPLVVGGVPFSAEALTARLLRWIVDSVAEQRGEPPSHIALSYPANWGVFKQERLDQAVRIADLAELVGSDGVTTVTEPAAAAISYAATERVPVGEVIAVYDLGGGTFDAAVLRKTAGGFEVLGRPEGIERLGGIDVDEAVFSYVRSALGDAIDLLDPDDVGAARAVARLRNDCIEAKEALSSDTQVSIPVLLPNLNTEVRITRAELESMVRPVLGDSVAALRRAISSAGLAADAVDRVLLVGGSSRMPLVAELVTEALGRPFFVDAHPKHAVALGAAIAAAAPAAPVPAAPSPSGPPLDAAVPPPGPPAGAAPPAPERSPGPLTVPAGDAPGSPAGSVPGPPPSGGAPPLAGTAVPPPGPPAGETASPAPPRPLVAGTPSPPDAPAGPPGALPGGTPPPPPPPPPGPPTGPGDEVDERRLAGVPAAGTDDTATEQTAVTEAVPSADDRGPRREAPGEGRRWLPLAGAAAAVVVLGVAAFLVLRGGDDSGGGGGGSGGNGGEGGEAPELTLAGTTDVGNLPDGIAVDGEDVWVASTFGPAVQRLDEATGTVEESIPFGGEPLGVVVAEGSVWVTQRAAGTVTRLDPASGVVQATIDMPDQPGGITAGAGAVWVTGAGSTLTRIDPATDTAELFLEGRGRIAGVGVTPDVVWVALLQDDGQVLAIDPSSGEELDRVAVGVEPDSLIVAPSGVWVANRGGGTVDRIDPSDRTVTATVEVGDEPTGLVADGDDRIWVISQTGGRLELIDAASATIVAQLPLGGRPLGVAVSPGTVWVTLGGDSQVARVEVSPA